MAMFTDETTDLQHQRVIYAHCDPGCGMEYELDPESGVLRYWHDGVGQVMTTTLQGPHDWDAILAAHASHENEED
jgi:hypothetical protein